MSIDRGLPQATMKIDVELPLEVQIQIMDSAKKSLAPVTIDGVTYTIRVTGSDGVVWWEVRDMVAWTPLELRRRADLQRRAFGDDVGIRFTLRVDWTLDGREYTYQNPVIGDFWAEIVA